MWDHMGYYNGGWGGMGLGMIGMSLFWILLIVAIVALVKRRGDREPPPVGARRTRRSTF